MGDECQIHQSKPPDPVSYRPGMQPQDQPDEQGRKGGEHEKRVAGTPVIGERLNGIADWNKEVKIGQQTTNTAPQQGTFPDLSSHDRLADSST